MNLNDVMKQYERYGDSNEVNDELIFTDVKKASLDYIKIIMEIRKVECGHYILSKSILELGLKYNLFLISQEYTELEIFTAIFGDFTK